MRAFSPSWWWTQTKAIFLHLCKWEDALENLPCSPGRIQTTIRQAAFMPSLPGLKPQQPHIMRKSLLRDHTADQWVAGEKLLAGVARLEELQRTLMDWGPDVASRLLKSSLSGGANTQPWRIVYSCQRYLRLRIVQYMEQERIFIDWTSVKHWTCYWMCLLALPTWSCVLSHDRK